MANSFRLIDFPKENIIVSRQLTELPVDPLKIYGETLQKQLFHSQEISQLSRQVPHLMFVVDGHFFRIIDFPKER